jgi:hypothetical protein
MANSLQLQTLEEGPVNLITKITGMADTANPPYSIIANPYTITIPPRPLPPVTFRIDFIEYSISDGIEVSLWWDSGGQQSSSTVIGPFAGRGNKHFLNFGGLINNATNPSGCIGMSIGLLPGYSYQAGVPFTYTIVLDLKKQFRFLNTDGS